MSDRIRKIVEAVLYEGYLLWPYRRSALKNQQRWTFGGVYPAAYSGSSGGTDRDQLQTEVLVEMQPAARLTVTVRFLQVVARAVHRLGPDGLEPVDELTVGGTRHLTWDEATERELVVEASTAELRRGLSRPIDVAAGADVEWLEDTGRRAGALVRTWEDLAGRVDVRLTGLAPGLDRLTVRVTNLSDWPGTDRSEAVRRTLVSTHAILRVDGGGFLSAIDPPEGLRAEAEACRNVGTWPVLVGEEGERHTMLSSPVILYDHPEVAPESPGDMFDGCEIDQLLVLNVLALTPEEQREMADTDPRARQILERTQAMSGEELMRLHGTIRDLRRLER